MHVSNARLLYPLPFLHRLNIEVSTMLGISTKPFLQGTMPQLDCAKVINVKVGMNEATCLGDHQTHGPV
jgi:hypothetical protein